MLAIPHNGNLSNGRMFELTDFAGKPLTRDYAGAARAGRCCRKSCRPRATAKRIRGISPNDEFAGDLGIAGLGERQPDAEGQAVTPEMMPTNYMRGGLLRGLEQEAKLGVNPFKFGHRRQHRRAQLAHRDRGGQLLRQDADQEPSPTAGSTSPRRGFGKTRYNWHYLAAGYAAVWATENTREALWDAMKRKEVYGTSGTRMTVRFFGG